MYVFKDGYILYHMNNIRWKRRFKSDLGLINLNLKPFYKIFKLPVYNCTNSARSTINIKAVLHESVMPKSKFEKAYDDLDVRFSAVI